MNFKKNASYIFYDNVLFDFCSDFTIIIEINILTLHYVELFNKGHHFECWAKMADHVKFIPVVELCERRHLWGF